MVLLDVRHLRYATAIAVLAGAAMFGAGFFVGWYVSLPPNLPTDNANCTWPIRDGEAVTTARIAGKYYCWELKR